MILVYPLVCEHCVNMRVSPGHQAPNEQPVLTLLNTL